MSLPDKLSMLAVLAVWVPLLVYSMIRRDADRMVLGSAFIGGYLGLCLARHDRQRKP